MRKILIFNDNQRTRNITQPYHVDIRVAVTGREVGTVVTCMSQCVCGWRGAKYSQAIMYLCAVYMGAVYMYIAHCRLFIG